MKRIVLWVALALCALASSEAAAKTTKHKTSAPGLHLKAVGIAVGFVSPKNTDGTFSLGAFADCGMLTPKIGLESRLDYWSHSESSFGVDASVSDVTLGARGKYYFEAPHSNLRPFVGTGLGIHFLHADVVIPPQGGFPALKAEDSSTKLGLDVGGGFSTAINPRADLLAEMWYGIVSDVNQFSLRLGVSRRLGS